MRDKRRKSTTPGGEPPATEAIELAERWSAARKAELVLRLLRRDTLDAVSRESQVPAHELETWKRVFLEQGTRGLRIRGEPDERELTLARAKIGELMMRLELAEDLIEKGLHGRVEEARAMTTRVSPSRQRRYPLTMICGCIDWRGRASMPRQRRPSPSWRRASPAQDVAQRRRPGRRDPGDPGGDAVSWRRLPKDSSPSGVNSRLICAIFSLPECAIGRGTVSATVTSDRGGKEGAYSHGPEHDQVPEAAGAVQHPNRLARWV
jgi:hypothetical protein